MPRQSTIEKARKDARAGKAPSTQAGEFVREEIDEVRAGKHGVRNTKQAIAIGLSKARKAGVDLPPRQEEKKSGEKKTARKARSSKTAKRKVSASSSARRSKAALNALKKESTSPVSHKNLSKQAKSVAARKGPAKRSAAAIKAVQTKKQSTQTRRVLAG